ncbi:hypothetical protein [Roseibium sp.]
MFHLGLGAIGIAFATALMFFSAMRSVEGALSQAGITLAARDMHTLAAGTLKDPAVAAVLNQLDGKNADLAATAVRESFAAGLHSAFWFGLAVALVGIVVSLSVDEGKLKTEPQAT